MVSRGNVALGGFSNESSFFTIMIVGLGKDWPPTLKPLTVFNAL